jgi:hypothetical protein
MLHAELSAGVGPASNDGGVRQLGAVLKLCQIRSFKTSVATLHLGTGQRTGNGKREINCGAWD